MHEGWSGYRISFCNTQWHHTKENVISSPSKPVNKSSTMLLVATVNRFHVTLQHIWSPPWGQRQKDPWYSVYYNTVQPSTWHQAVIILLFEQQYIQYSLSIQLVGMSSSQTLALQHSTQFGWLECTPTVTECSNNPSFWEGKGVLGCNFVILHGYLGLSQTVYEANNQIQNSLQSPLAGLFNYQDVTSTQKVSSQPSCWKTNHQSTVQTSSQKSDTQENSMKLRWLALQQVPQQTNFLTEKKHLFDKKQQHLFDITKIKKEASWNDWQIRSACRAVRAHIQLSPLAICPLLMENSR